jgi:CRP-like cAMP-binding protein
MVQDSILSNIAKHISLTKKEKDYFCSLLREEAVPKKGYLLQEGQVCRNISFVHSGALRAFHLDQQGREATIMFAIADWWITDMYCFINSKPAMLYIQAIEDSCILKLSREQLEELYVRTPKFERFFRIIMQGAYIREQLRVIQNLSLPAEERYDQFLSKYPQIAKKVTQKQIASYLGITPEFLSAIRGSKGRGKKS